jgi:glycerate kinase
MKIVLAPNPLKGSLTAREACETMAEGVRRVLPEAQAVRVPFADGQDGLVEGFEDLFAGRRVKARVNGPAWEKVSVFLCHVRDRELAGVEAAQASGLGVHTTFSWDPLRTTTYGVGQLIRAALRLRVRRIVMGISGVAANDGGVGMASALGVRFLDRRGRSVQPVGGELHRIRRIDASGLDPRLKKVCVDILCDEDTLLLGKHGAATLEARRKGASPKQVEFLEGGMVNLAMLLQRDIGVDVRQMQGGGAGGGLAAGLHAFLGGRLRRSVDIMLELAGLEEWLQDADLVLTTEGGVRGEGERSKGPQAVAACAGRRRIPCIMLAGSVEGERTTPDSNVTAALSICPGPVSLHTAMENAGPYLQNATEQVLRIYSASESVRSARFRR